MRRWPLRIASVAVCLALAWSFLMTNHRPVAALVVALTALAVVLAYAIWILVAAPVATARVTSTGRRSIEAAAHVALLGSADLCLHEPGLALPGCECRLA